MDIVIKSYHKTIQPLRDMLIDYNLDGGKILRTGGDDRTLPFDHAGEREVTQQQYDDLSAVPDIRIEKALLFFLFTKEQMDNEVPESYPDREDEGVVLTYGKYFRSDTTYPVEQPDGTFLMRIARTALELTDVDRRIYHDDLGGLLVRSKGEELMKTSVAEI